MRLFKYISIFTVILLAALYFISKPQPYQIYSGKIFGTYYNIKTRLCIKNNEIEEKIKHILEDVNMQMSVFEKESELNKINRLPAGTELPLSPEMSMVLRTADEIYELSAGSFDPTVAPLIDLWGFGIRKNAKFPNEKQIKQALHHVGYKKLNFSSDFKTIWKNDSAIRLNLSAIAKGYAVDRVADFLSRNGCRNFVVEIGGEVRAAGERAAGSGGWNIGIRNPSEENNLLALHLTDKAVATSGDYQNYFIKDGIRYAHTISPQTGYPLDDRLTSATVIDESAMRADALATAIMALGYPAGIKFADSNHIPAIFFTRNDEKNEGKRTIKMIFSQSAKKILGE